MRYPRQPRCFRPIFHNTEADPKAGARRIGKVARVAFHTHGADDPHVPDPSAMRRSYGRASLDAGDLAVSPLRAVRRLAGRRGKGAASGAQRHGPVDGGRRRPAERPHGAAQGVRRARLHVLHQPALAQGPRARAEPVRRAALPVGRPRAARDRRRRRRARRPRRGAGYSPPGRTGRRWAPGPPARSPRWSRRGRRWRRSTPSWPGAGPRGRRCPCRTTGAATAVVPETVEFWQGRPSRMHDRLRYRRVGPEWVVERLAP